MDTPHIFDENTGEHIGTLLTEEDAPTSFPVEISFLKDGCWYVFKLDRKYAADDVHLEAGG